jgi:hypothetical protein
VAERPPCLELAETFETRSVNPERWLFTSAPAFHEKRQDVVRRGRGRDADYELRLAADTRGVGGAVVSRVGVVHPRPIDLRVPHEIDLQLDWNAQGDDRDVRAGAYLAPVLTWESPESQADWLKFEYVGVPPGGTARAVLAVRREGRVEELATEGWPGRRPAGRLLGHQALRIALGGGALRIQENGALWHEAAALGLPFPSAYLYLQMSTRSDRPLREVFFDDVVIRRACSHAAGGL